MVAQPDLAIQTTEIKSDQEKIIPWSLKDSYRNMQTGKHYGHAYAVYFHFSHF